MEAVLTDLPLRPDAPAPTPASQRRVARELAWPQAAPTQTQGSARSTAYVTQRRSRPASVAAVLAVHLVLAVGIWQGWSRPEKPRPKLLVPVRWIAPPETRPQPKPQPRPEIKATPERAVPVSTPTVPAVAPVAMPIPASPAPERVQPVVEVVAAAAPAPVAAPAPPPTKVALNAPRYLVEPKLNMPLASRRLGEQGLVQLRLHIGPQGELLGATLARSSGFERLDAQALKDIRTARFAPLVENGHAVEWECLALLSYELTR